MQTDKTTTIYTPLTHLKPVKLIEEQLSRFNLESIHSREVASFDPNKAIELLKLHEGQLIIGGDFGGDKGVTKLFQVQNGHLVINPAYQDYVQGNDGEGYLESLEKTANFASEKNIPVGLSWGTPLKGTIPEYHPKAKIFLEKLSNKYGGDFKRLVPTLTSCMNDGPAGAVSAIVQANRQSTINSLLFSINGGGLGMSVFHDGKLYATESGHVEAVPQLNTYHQDTPCGVYGATYVCVERLGANKAGIEAQWTLLKGEVLHAKEIEDRYKEGDTLAGELYEHSAIVTAHYIEGTARAFGIELSDERSMIAGHGGAYKFPYFGERVQQIIGFNKGKASGLIMTKDYGIKDSNACLDGAAISALINLKST